MHPVDLRCSEENIKKKRITKRGPKPENLLTQTMSGKKEDRRIRMRDGKASAEPVGVYGGPAPAYEIAATWGGSPSHGGRAACQPAARRMSLQKLETFSDEGSLV